MAEKDKIRLFWGKSSEKPNKRFELKENYFEKLNDTEKIWEIFDSVLNSPLNSIELDFSKCKNLSNTGLTILASLGPLCSAKNRSVTICPGKNFEWMGRLVPISRKTSKLKWIPFKSIKDEESIENILDDLNTIEGVSDLPKEIRSEIRSRIYELCINAYEHGKNKNGAVCNGIYDRQEFTFSVFDFGEGIKNNVNTYLNKELTTIETLEWAFKYSNSTCQNITIPRGAGFTTIFDFVQKYKGQFTLYTDNIYCSYKNGKYYYKELEYVVPGTLITVTISIM